MGQMLCEEIVYIKHDRLMMGVGDLYLGSSDSLTVNAVEQDQIVTTDLLEATYSSWSGNGMYQIKNQCRLLVWQIC